MFFEFRHSISPVSLVKVSVTKINTEDFKLIGHPGDVNRSSGTPGLRANPCAHCFLGVKPQARSSLENINKVKSACY